MDFFGARATGPMMKLTDIIGFPEFGSGLQWLVIYGHRDIGVLGMVFMDGMQDIGEHISDFMAALITDMDMVALDLLEAHGREDISDIIQQ
jgi:hypothetical protein